MLLNVQKKTCSASVTYSARKMGGKRGSYFYFRVRNADQWIRHPRTGLPISVL